MTNTTTLSLSDRPAKIGSSINVRTEKHGDEDVPACDIPITGFLLEAGELDSLLGKGAYKALYRDGKGNATEPRFEHVSELVLDEKFLGTVTLDLDSIEVQLSDENVTLASISLTPQVGGLTAMSLKVQCTPSNEEIAQLAAAMNHDIRCEISFGGKKQPKGKKQRELPMSHTAPTDEAADAAPATH